MNEIISVSLRLDVDILCLLLMILFLHNIFWVIKYCLFSDQRHLSMYTLLSGLYKYMTEKEEYFVLILGLDNAGKTTFLESAKTKLTPNYKGVNLNKITTTVGMNLGKIDVNGVRLNFWDLGGQEELQSLWDKYYSGDFIFKYMKQLI